MNTFATLTILNKFMETSKEYYEKIMSSFKANRKGRTLRRYCLDEGVDYQWMLKTQKEQAKCAEVENVPGTHEHFIPLEVSESSLSVSEWSIESLVLSGTLGKIEVKCSTLSAAQHLLMKLA